MTFEESLHFSFSQALATCFGLPRMTDEFSRLVPAHSMPHRVACRFLGAAILAAVSACGSVDQQGFEKEIRASIHEGMPASDAVLKLKSQGLGCELSRDSDPNADCTRIDHRLLVTCVMRVTFVVDSASGSVRNLNISKAACAGL